MQKSVSETFKRIRSGKPDAGEASHIEEFLKQNIQENYNLTPRTSPVYYDDILLPEHKICRVKNKPLPFSNWQSGKI